MVKVWCIFLSLILFTHCSIQKRKYQKGYYFNFHKNTTKNELVKNNSFGKELKLKQTVSQEETTKTLLVKQLYKENNSITLTKTSSPPDSLTKDSCDVILSQSGDEIRAKIQEITPHEIKYKKCNLPEGVLYVVDKSTVFMIRYANGTKEIIKSKKTEQQSGGVTKKPKIPNSVMLGLSLGAVSIIYYFLFILGPLAILLGVKGLRKIESDKTKYRGKSMAKATIALGIIGTIVSLAVLLVLLLPLLI